MILVLKPLSIVNWYLHMFFSLKPSQKKEKACPIAKRLIPEGFARVPPERLDPIAPWGWWSRNLYLASWRFSAFLPGHGLSELVIISELYMIIYTYIYIYIYVVICTYGCIILYPLGLIWGQVLAGNSRYLCATSHPINPPSKATLGCGSTGLIIHDLRPPGARKPRASVSPGFFERHFGVHLFWGNLQ